MEEELVLYGENSAPSLRPGVEIEIRLIREKSFVLGPGLFEIMKLLLHNRIFFDKFQLPNGLTMKLNMKYDKESIAV